MSVDYQQDEQTEPQTEEIPERSSVEDIETLIPGPEDPVRLQSGTWIKVNRLKLRELLALLKIVTRGATYSMGGVRLDVNDPDFAQSLITLLLLAIPEADDEVVDFFKLVCEPHIEGLSTEEDKLIARRLLDKELDNPDFDDLVTIIEVVAHREASDIRRLGKRLASALQFARKTGQLKDTAPQR